MHPTRFYGLTELDPGDPITVDGASFLRDNPRVTDSILHVGAVTHRHDAHLALPNPAGLASATVVTSGGTISAGQSLFLAYTLIDSDLGETLRSAAILVTTADPTNDPSAAITAVFDPSAGSLPAGQFAYALTLNDAGGGESTLGPAIFVTRSPGYASGQVNLAGLAGDLGGTGPFVSWNLWRMQDGGSFEIVATAGVGDTFTDTGLICTDAARNPPNDMSGVQSGNALVVTLPDASQDPSVTDAVSFGLYLSIDGSFANPCFYAGYPVASAGVAIDIPTILLHEGAPPRVSLASVGASLIDPDTDMLDFPWKRPVASASMLPTVGNADGDMREVLDTHILYVWDEGTLAWNPGGGAVGADGPPGASGTNTVMVGGLGPFTDVHFVAGTETTVVETDLGGGVVSIEIDATGGSLGSDSAVRAYSTTTPGLTGGDQKVVLDSVAEDNGSRWDAGDARYVAPRTGTYQINALIGLTLAAPDAGMFMAVVKINGSTAADGQAITPRGIVSGDVWSVLVADLVKLNAGDYIEIFINSPAGGGGAAINAAVMSLVQVG